MMSGGFADEDDFMADLEAAVEAQLKGVEDIDTDKPEPDEVEETQAEEEERLYRRDGRRFVAKDADKEKAEPAAAAPEVKTEETPKPSWRPLWYKQEHGDWDKYPEALRQAIREQERNAAQAIEKHANSVKAWEPIQQALTPHMQELQAQGLTPQTYVNNLIEADKYLRQDPVAAIQWLARAYLNADIGQVADYIAQNPQAANGGYRREDPLQRELQTLKQQLEELKQAPIQQQRERLQSEITTWAKDKPYFDDVRVLMGQLARTPQYEGASLDTLYEAAMRSHPQLYERILEDKRKTEVAKARAAAATSPRGAPSPEGKERSRKSKSSTKDIEDAVAAAYDEVHSN